ncbi:olfactory receptor 51L1-like [Myripristis murdjan]|uniref:Olfactory receptor n=1 Tax=Myripristis murdjan TaxID=586833 RepID=A0A668A5C2_9TELE|nr:olfactory receptor 51L1-like [Myripristis murdjan]
MDNTSVTTFIMAAYAVMENYKYVQFAIFLLLYFVIITLNVQLIAIIYRHKELHQPMNAFPCILSINAIYGSTALLPATLIMLTSKTFEVNVKWCLAQVYFLHTYAAIEFCVLAVMGYDRYVAICYPLHYHSIMSVSRVGRLVVLVCLYPVIVFLLYFSLTLQLKFCGAVIQKLYCVNIEVVKNSCSGAPYISIVGLALIMIFIVPQLLMILFSYIQILRVCKQLPKGSQVKALKTCIPHLLTLANYTVGSLFEIFQSRFDMSHVIPEARIFMSLYFVIIPSVVNPVLYGLGTQLIRVHYVKLFLGIKAGTRKEERQRLQLK